MKRAVVASYSLLTKIKSNSVTAHFANGTFAAESSDSLTTSNEKMTDGTLSGEHYLPFGMN